MDPMTLTIPVLCTVFLMALLMWARARRHIRQSGIPDGSVVYQDSDGRRYVERPLVSPSCRLTGKPDYLVEDHQHAARCHACGYRAVCDEALD